MSTHLGWLTSILYPLVDRQTYKNLIYLTLAFPLGVFYWTFLFVGFIFGLVLTVVLVGIGLLLGIVLGSRLVARFERWLAAWILGIDIPAIPSVGETDGHLDTIRAYLDDPFTWRGLGFVLLKFWLGMIGFLLVYGLFQSVSMVSALFRLPHELNFGEVNGEPVVWTVETLPEAGLALMIGVGLGVVVLHLTNGFAYVTGRMAVALLGGNARTG